MDKINRRSVVSLLTSLIVCLGACQPTEKQGQNLYDFSFRYAKRLTVKYDNAGQYLMTVTYNTDSLLYKIPSNVRKIACTSATHVAMLELLGADSCLVGFFGGDVLYSPRQRERYASATIKELGTINQPDLEALLVLQPDVILISSRPEELPVSWSIVRQAGIAVIFIAEWLENTPLGRSEWLKVMGILVGDTNHATQVFDSIATRYENKRAQVIHPKTPVSVMVGNGYQGVWYVPAGESYVAAFLKDAGATYPWADTKGEASLQMDFESIYTKGRETDLWLNVGSCGSLAELISYDIRLADFKAIRQKRVFNNNKRTNAAGINQYYETSVIEPDKVLSDIINILQNNLADLYYYQPLLSIY